MPKQLLCPSCKVHLKPGRHLSSIKDNTILATLTAVYNSTITLNSKVCDSCRLLSKRQETKSEETEGPSNPKKLKLPIPRCIVSESKCIVCKNPNGRYRIAPKARLKVFIDTDILISPNAMSDSVHIQESLLTESAVNAIETSPFSDVDLTANELTELLNSLREQARKKGLNFEDSSADGDYIID